MEALGAYTQQDLLDLELEDYELLEMRPLELKRFEQMISALEAEKAKIVSGEIKVHDYMSDNTCPAK